ncbi:hypothetical protein CLOP_g7496 [Closterium sp. NIES-67]|nr:hypothetical protein CLOP_g7496 [Closterium sp. NIES-67]
MAAAAAAGLQAASLAYCSAPSRVPHATMKPAALTAAAGAARHVSASPAPVGAAASSSSSRSCGSRTRKTPTQPFSSHRPLRADPTTTTLATMATMPTSPYDARIARCIERRRWPNPECRDWRKLGRKLAVRAALGGGNQGDGNSQTSANATDSVSAASDTAADLAAAAQSAAAAAGAIPMDSPRTASPPPPAAPLPRLTPYSLLKLVVAAIIAVTAGRAVFGAVIGAALHPEVLLRASWLLVVWPWPAAALIAAWTAATAAAGGGKKQPLWKQVGVLLGALTWLILGYLDGWRVSLCVLYAVFFSASAVVRLQLYGDLAPPSKDRQQATATSRTAQVLFVLSVVGGHWYAAFESASQSAFLTLSTATTAATSTATAAGAAAPPPVVAAPFAAALDPWASRLAPVLLVVALWLHWDAAFFLGKYFDRLVVPRAIVTVGPYRSLRHPLYTSYMLLFCAFCLSLHSYKAMLFLFVASLLYYRARIALEEAMLRKSFPEYQQYCQRVPYRLLPYVY